MMPEDKELEAMGAITRALVGLDDAVVARVLRWSADRHRITLTLPKSDATQAATDVVGGSDVDLATLFASFGPQLDAEKALIVAYWLQVVRQGKDFEAQPLNTELKNLGHGVGNITDALSTLMARRPSLVLQVQKSGTSRQARKRYRLTAAGITEVTKKIAANVSGEANSAGSEAR